MLSPSLVLPMEIEGGLFSFSFYSKKKCPYVMDHLILFDNIKSLWSNSVEGLLDSKKWNREHSRSLTSERTLRQRGFEGIIGNSHFLLSLFDMITQVAPTETSVLLLGESGTGKELIADCIYNLSTRQGKPFIKLNCATLPRKPR